MDETLNSVAAEAATSNSPSYAGTLLRRIEDALPELSKSERRVASFLLKAPQELVGTSVKDLAQRLGVSEPTIIRFCRTIGCDGYKDLKIQLAQDLAVRQALKDSVRPSSERKAAPRILNSNPEMQQDFAAAVFAGAVEALESARNEFDETALNAAAAMVAGAARVIVLGIGGSSAVLGSEVQNRLLRLNVSCVAITDSYVQRMTASTLGPGDVAIFVSSTGRPQSLQDSAELARYYGAKCIGITPSDSPLARELDICLNLELTQSGVGQFQPNPMRFAQLFLIDCLAFAIAGQLGEAATRSLERGRASVASLHGIAPNQPIGD